MTPRQRLDVVRAVAACPRCGARIGELCWNPERGNTWFYSTHYQRRNAAGQWNKQNPAGYRAIVAAVECKFAGAERAVRAPWSRRSAREGEEANG